MNDSFIRVTELANLPQGAARVFRVQGRAVALFHVNGSVYALDNACPHRDGPLGEGTLNGTQITCPRHGWTFDVLSGACSDRPGRKAVTYAVRIEDGEVQVCLPAAPATGSSATQFLVRFGAMGYVGRFRATDHAAVPRGSRVVVRSSRGLELGEVLWSGEADSEVIESQPDCGVVLREMEPDDIVKEKIVREVAGPAFDVCRQVLEERSVSVELVDAEPLFDGETIIFYFLGEPPATLADISTQLAARLDAHVQFRPFGDRLDACGGCGSEGAHGCGECRDDGSCGRQGDVHGSCCGESESKTS